jgi:hypothetical protein
VQEPSNLAAYAAERVALVEATSEPGKPVATCVGQSAYARLRGRPPPRSMCWERARVCQSESESESQDIRSDWGDWFCLFMIQGLGVTFEGLKFRV